MLIPVFCLSNHAGSEVELHVVCVLTLLRYLNLLATLRSKSPEFLRSIVDYNVWVVRLEARTRLVNSRLIYLKVVLFVEVGLEGAKVVSVPFGIFNSDKSLQSVSAGRNPTAMYIRIRAKNRLRLEYINVIEIKNNESAMVFNSLVTPRCKLTTKANNRQFCFGLLIASPNLFNRCLRIAISDSR